MGWSKSSATRVMRFGRKYSYSQILLIQAAFTNKNPDLIRKVVKKTKKELKDPSAIAYGRLANQYISHIAEPTRYDKWAFKDLFDVEMIDIPPDPTKTLNQNLKIIDDYMGRTSHPPPPPPPKSKLQAILDRVWLFFKETNDYAQVETLDYDKFTAIKVKNYVIFAPSDIMLLRREKVHSARIFAKLRFSSGNKQIVSSPVYDISDYDVPLRFLDQYGIYKDVEDISPIQIYDKFDFTKKRIVREKIEAVETIWIRFYKD